jgi:hypothetical protein
LQHGTPLIAVKRFEDEVIGPRRGIHHVFSIRSGNS